MSMNRLQVIVGDLLKEERRRCVLTDKTLMSFHDGRVKDKEVKTRRPKTRELTQVAHLPAAKTQIEAMDLRYFTL